MKIGLSDCTTAVGLQITFCVDFFDSSPNEILGGAFCKFADNATGGIGNFSIILDSFGMLEQGDMLWYAKVDSYRMEQQVRASQQLMQHLLPHPQALLGR